MLLPLLEATADAATDVGTRSPFTSVLYWVFMILWIFGLLEVIVSPVISVIMQGLFLNIICRILRFLVIAC